MDAIVSHGEEMLVQVQKDLKVARTAAAKADENENEIEEIRLRKLIKKLKIEKKKITNDIHVAKKKKRDTKKR